MLGTVKRRLLVRLPLGVMNYCLLILSFFPASIKAKLSVEFHHSVRNELENSAESRQRSVLTLGSLCLAICSIQCKAKNKRSIYYHLLEILRHFFVRLLYLFVMQLDASMLKYSSIQQMYLCYCVFYDNICLRFIYGSIKL